MGDITVCEVSPEDVGACLVPSPPVLVSIQPIERVTVKATITALRNLILLIYRLQK
jgi:hypothetical protein